jgi:hypothetical protein
MLLNSYLYQKSIKQKKFNNMKNDILSIVPKNTISSTFNIYLLSETKMELKKPKENKGEELPEIKHIKVKNENQSFFDDSKSTEDSSDDEDIPDLEDVSDLELNEDIKPIDYDNIDEYDDIKKEINIDDKPVLVETNNDNPVELDNLHSDGYQSENPDTKNVVVSFF